MADGSRHSLHIVEEGVGKSNWGKTPERPKMGTVRNTGVTVGLAKDSLQSEEIRNDRQLVDFRLGSDQVGGDINIELSYGSFDDLFLGVLQGKEWLVDGLTGIETTKPGTTRRSFTLMRHFADIEDGQKPFHILKAVEVDSFTLNFAANAMVTGSFSVLGQSLELSNSAIVGSTIDEPTSTMGMDSFTGTLRAGDTDLCVVTEASLTLENSLAARFVLCKKQSIYPESGRSILTGSITAYFEDSTLLERFINEESSSLILEATDPDGNSYRFTIPKLVYTGGQPDVAGEGSIVLTLPFQAVYDPVTKTNLEVRKSSTNGPNAIVLGVGDELMRGKMHSSNSRPSQPEIADNHKLFNGIPNSGLGASLATSDKYASVIPYAENGDDNEYTIGTGLLSGLSANGDAIFANTGIDGLTIEQLNDRTTHAGANMIKYCQGAKKLYPDVHAAYMAFVQGEADKNLAVYHYLKDFRPWLSRVRDSIKGVIEKGNLDVLVAPYGGTIEGRYVTAAQVQAYHEGLIKITSATYWLHRGLPSKSTAPIDRSTLNVFGYKFLGDMLARAARGAVPIVATKYEWLSKRQIQITCLVPEGGELEIATSDFYKVTTCPGNGIALRKGDGRLLPSTQTSVSGDKIFAEFSEDIEVDDAIEIGTTATDLGFNSDATQPSNDAILSTNIRCNIKNPGPLGLGDYNDWLVPDVHVMHESDSGFPNYTRGTNVYMKDTSPEGPGAGDNFEWNGSNVTRTLDGSAVPATATTLTPYGISDPRVFPALKQNDRYEITADNAEVLSSSGQGGIKFTIGRDASGWVNPGDSGAYSTIVMADGSPENFTGFLMQVTNAAIRARISGIQIRRVLDTPA